MRLTLNQHYTYPKLLLFCLPSIIMMVFTSLYTIVDGIFVSNMAGSDAFAALNLIWPVIGMIGAFGFMIGSGGTALIAKQLGEQKEHEACENFSMLICFEIAVGLVISLSFALIVRPLSIALGADDHLVDYCVQYGFIMLVLQTFYFLQTTFQSFLVAAGRPALGLYISLAAGVLNMILDYVFISVFGWGIAGAALATGINWFVASIIPAVFFFVNKSTPLHFCRFSWRYKDLWKACTNGLSEMVTSLSSSFVYMLYNYELLKIAGNDGVIAYGVVQYIALLLSAVFFGYTMACAPLISYQYGAKNHEQLHNLLKKSLVIITIASLAVTIAARLASYSLAAVFVSYSPELMEITHRAVELFALSFLMTGLNIFFSGFFTALNNGAVSAFLSLCRTFVFQAGAIVLLPLFFGISGIWLASLAAESLSLVVSIAVVIKYRRRYNY